jgi:hypothetical protein
MELYSTTRWTKPQEHRLRGGRATRGQHEYENQYSRTSSELALKPGTMSGREGFLSPSLAAMAAALALSMTCGSANSTGCAGAGTPSWGLLFLSPSCCAKQARRIASSAACCSIMRASGRGASGARGCAGSALFSSCVMGLTAGGAGA